jgi:hypothetical protein
MSKALNSKEIAKFAAQGVSIALRARDEQYKGPFHIICGIPPDEIYKVIIEADAEGNLQVGSVRTQEE